MTAARSGIVVLVLLIGGTVATFGHVCANDFINYDDPFYVTDNPAVRGGLTARGIRWAWTTTYFANCHPLTWMSLQLDAQLYGSKPFGYHSTNLLLHVANVVLLFWVFRRMTGAVWRSAL